jgi:hypothetical protein
MHKKLQVQRKELILLYTLQLAKQKAVKEIKVIKNGKR